MARKMNFEVTKARAGFLVLDAGPAEFDITDVKTFSRIRTNDDGTEDPIFGLTYKATVTAHEENKEHVGEEITIPLYMHTEKTGNMIKQFLLAGYGFDVKDEAAFNEQYGENPDLWAIEWPEVEGEEATIGDGWRHLVGRKISAMVMKKANKQNPGQEQNQFNWFPFE